MHLASDMFYKPLVTHTRLLYCLEKLRRRLPLAVRPEQRVLQLPAVPRALLAHPAPQRARQGLAPAWPRSEQDNHCR